MIDDLFEYHQSQPYPDSPGFKAKGTSEKAAEETKPIVEPIRTQIMARLQLRPMTADECATRIGKSILAVRPRFSELARKGRIVATDEVRRNSSGKDATVWRVK